MSAWLYRWENGDCSIVWATTRIAAIEILDEVGEAQSRYLIPLMEAVETERTRVQYEATKAETPAGQVIADRMNVNPELADKWAREDEAAAAMAREDEAAQ